MWDEDWDGGAVRGVLLPSGLSVCVPFMYQNPRDSVIIREVKVLAWQSLRGEGPHLKDPGSPGPSRQHPQGALALGFMGAELWNHPICSRSRGAGGGTTGWVWCRPRIHPLHVAGTSAGERWLLPPGRPCPGTPLHSRLLRTVQWLHCQPAQPVSTQESPSDPRVPFPSP